MPNSSYDVVIVGGGPAGLSAALVLGRCRRRVCLVDSGHGRNERAPTAHGIFTREGASPAELRSMGREQLAAYDVTIHDEEVVEVTPREKAFTENRDRRLAAYAPADAGSATAWPSTKTT